MDVDGVITNLKDKRANPQMLQHLYQELVKGKPVALNTGRSLDTVMEKVIAPLTENHPDKSFLENLIAVGEKGGTWMTFGKEGKPQEHVDESISVSSNLQANIQNLIASKYSRSMFYDSSKKTMVSIEMKDGYDISKYERDQELLVPQVEKIIKRHGLEKNLVIELNPIAIDIQNKNVGKHLGMRHVLNWLRKRKIKVLNFITIGDMPSDIKMAEELHRNNFLVTHIHVGDKIKEHKYPFRIINTSSRYEKGAKEYLNGL